VVGRPLGQCWAPTVHSGGVLMIDETPDAPPPFEGSLAVRELFPGASPT
jgi:hypothetical protein